MSKPSNGLRAALEQVALEIARDVGHHGCARRIHAALEANPALVGAPEPECGHRLFDPGCSVCARTYFNWARDRIAGLECAVDENARLKGELAAEKEWWKAKERLEAENARLGGELKSNGEKAFAEVQRLCTELAKSKDGNTRLRALVESAAACEQEWCEDAQRGAAHPPGKLQRAALDMVSRKLHASAAAMRTALLPASDKSTIRQPAGGEGKKCARGGCLRRAGTEAQPDDVLCPEHRAEVVRDVLRMQGGEQTIRQPEACPFPVMHKVLAGTLREDCTQCSVATLNAITSAGARR